jgi:acetoin utilization protein AcuB
MLVRERMSRNPVTIQASASITEALRVMREKRVRRLPVLDEQGKMIGIVSEKDLLYASPSPATSLSIYEMHDLLTRLKVTELMTAEVITVSPDMPLEEAALIMADKKIGGLPVLEHGQLVGIITETDIFKVFLEMLGARQPGLRLTVEMPEQKGGSMFGDDPSRSQVTVKVDDVPTDQLIAAMNELGLEVLDVREIQQSEEMDG